MTAYAGPFAAGLSMYGVCQQTGKQQQCYRKARYDLGEQWIGVGPTETNHPDSTKAQNQRREREPTSIEQGQGAA
jgi:hypothetical protein